MKRSSAKNQYPKDQRRRHLNSPESIPTADTKFLAGGVFRDQPDGNCLNCHWNERVKHGHISCSCPTTYMSNPICLQKQILTHLGNIDLALYGDGDQNDSPNYP